jgi:hypothetical protein
MAARYLLVGRRRRRACASTPRLATSTRASRRSRRWCAGAGGRRGYSPKAFVGVYLTRTDRVAGTADVTYLRLAYVGTAGEPDPDRGLDHGIVGTLWMTLEELRASRERHRSPLVLRCVEDVAAGQRHPLDIVFTDPGVPAAFPLAARRSAAAVTMPAPMDGTLPRASNTSSSASRAASIRRSGLAAQTRRPRVVGIFMKNWEEDDDDEYCSSRQDSRCGERRRRDRHRAGARQLRRRVQGPGLRRVPA